MKKPDKYFFPAIFTYDFQQNSDIAVTFPDLPGCATSGETEAEALEMAKDALGGHLWCMEEDNDIIPAPTPLVDVHTESNERAILIEVFMPSIRLAQNNRSISRTVTLPAWLNAAAQELNINFSQVLQEALKGKINA